MTDFSTTVEQVGNTYPNPVLFTNGIAMAVTPLLSSNSNKYKFTQRQDRILVRGKRVDKSLNDLFIVIGVDQPALERRADSMLLYDPFPKSPKSVYSYQANRLAVYIGTEKEFYGPVFTSTEDMGMVIYIHSLSHITIEEIADMLLHAIEKYKNHIRGFFSYNRGQEDIRAIAPIWKLGLEI